MTMLHPTWVPYSFAVVMVAVSLYCIGRLVLAKPMGKHNHADVNISHVLMGLSMAGMLVPRWNKIPDGLWELVFAGISVYFFAVSVRFVRRHGLTGTGSKHHHHLSHYLIHAVMGCAMLYMYWLGAPTAASSGAVMAMSGPPRGAGDPSLTLLFIVVLIASAIWQLDAISRYSPGNQLVMSAVGAASGGGGSALLSVPEASDDGPWLAPRLEIACHIAMCITMGYMLIVMV